MKIVYIRSQRGAFAKDGKPALKCHPDGRVQANRFGEALLWEKWTLHCEIDGDDSIVAFQSWTGKFLSAKSDGNVTAVAEEIGESEKWRLEPSQRTPNFVALKSFHGNYLVCDGNFFNCGNTVRADRSAVKEWEEWVIVEDPTAFTNPGNTAKCAIGGTLIATGAILTLGAVAVPLAGFGVGGVMAGSTAAAAQSAFYGGATTGLFSILQSAGATLAWVPVCASGAAAATTGGVILNRPTEN
jgi:Fascin domain